MSRLDNKALMPLKSLLHPLEPGDQEVYDAARDVITTRFSEGRHHVGAAVRAASGKIYTGVHLQGVIGEPAVCAEKVAIGHAMTDGEKRIVTCVAIRHPKPREVDGRLWVLPPCGSCRELLCDYGGKNTWVILDVDGILQRARITDLLPLRRWERGATPPE
jgi:cytidine deaminase